MWVCRDCRWATASDGPCSFSRPGPYQDSSVRHSGRMWCFPGWPEQKGSKTLPLWTSSWTEWRIERMKGAEINFIQLNRRCFTQSSQIFQSDIFDDICIREVINLVVSAIFHLHFHLLTFQLHWVSSLSLWHPLLILCKFKHTQLVLPQC